VKYFILYVAAYFLQIFLQNCNHRHNWHNSGSFTQPIEENKGCEIKGKTWERRDKLNYFFK